LRGRIGIDTLRVSFDFHRPEPEEASPRPYQGLPDIDYPFHDRTIVVTHCGRICLGKKKINFSTAFVGQAVGIKEVPGRRLAGQLYRSGVSSA
jgi:hypothetical protein